ncbi:MAG: hypothetical protein COW47_01250 [Candidatus Huberarchaeum crystalense]|uniref:Uncharacterized protein n=1 Tax=Huberarchaeum crystalense TaxID=2014257 RepID=A0A2G9LIP8_HUBC1|nr:hypothetical protein [archaeon]OIP20836.1 MAG: hypothetical protein AUJ91_00100 [archaeon CG2_30_31_98]PIN66417.1 MAG: hypothetical protein COW69_02475 [Candidatus Huberarchaeum crystalense]NCS98211.1 hypothetical protein [archaeon]PIV13563.1 MAG: hypothetical protein COS45_02325 [Candidatus Huberarchaeum crystalense]
MGGVYVGDTTNSKYSVEDSQSKKRATQIQICLGKVCIRHKDIVEPVIGANTIYGLGLFNIGFVCISLSIFNLLTFRFGTEPNTFLIFSVVSFMLLFIIGVLFKGFEG